MGSMRPRYPIVLCHGLMDVGRLLQIQYFNRVADVLRQDLGCIVHEPLIPHGADIPKRAGVLKDFLMNLMGSGNCEPSQRFNLIAHSLGGLDARYLVSHLDGYQFVASITTIATPHRGTTLADWGVSTLGQRLRIEAMLRYAGIDAKVFYDLTTTSQREFNIRTPNHCNVQYFSFGASKPPIHIPFVLRPSHAYIASREGDNDGLVSVISAKWGQYLGTIAADHYEQVDWRLPGSGECHFDASVFFRDVICQVLAERGL